MADPRRETAVYLQEGVLHSIQAGP